MTQHVHEFSWITTAPKTDVFDALTTVNALEQWFAEHAEVDLKVGGAFRFWGRHTLDGPSKAEATQTIIEVAAAKRLSFNWRLLNCDSKVAWELSDSDEGGTIVAGRHVFPTLPEGERVKDMIDDLWKLHGGNFVQYLTGGEGLCLPDYNDPNPAIKQSILIDATRSRVFQALITPEIMARWLYAENAVVDPCEGGAYSYGWNYQINGKDVAGGPTRIIEYVENEKLVTDWPDWRGDDSVPDQTVTWLLEDVGNQTRVTVIHAGFVRAVDFSDFPFGWGDFLAGLAGTLGAES